VGANLADVKRHNGVHPFRRSASHRKTAIFGWLAFVLAAIAIGA
jgi:hypothetical protein